MELEPLDLEPFNGLSRTAAAHEAMIRNAIARQAGRIARTMAKRAKLRRALRVVEEQLRHERRMLRAMKLDTLPQ